MKKWIIAGCSLLVCCCFIFYFAVSADASIDTTAHPKLVKSICIEKDDSLWSIASANYSNYFGSIDDYIQEIKQVNNLQSDTVHTGNYLVIPYYAQ